MRHPLKNNIKNVFINALAIVYLLFIIAYQLNVPTTAHFFDSDTYHGTMSAADVFQEESEEKPSEMDANNEEGSNPTEENRVEHPEEIEKKEVKNDEELPHEKSDKDNMSEIENLHSNQKQQPDTRSEQPKEEMEKTKQENDHIEEE